MRRALSLLFAAAALACAQITVIPDTGTPAIRGGGALAIPGAAAFTPITLINHATCAYSSASSGCTTTAKDMRGANFCVLEISRYTAGATNQDLPTDSSGNTWYGPVQWCENGTCGVSSQNRAAVYYAPNATVSSAQTFTDSTSGSYAGMVAACYSNVATTSPFAQNNQNNQALGTSISTGSATPATANHLMVTALENDSTATAPTVSAPFTLLDAGGSLSNANIAYGMAQLIETSATAQNATWSGLGNTQATTELLTFENAADGTPLSQFVDFETSTDGTTVSAAILAAGSHAAFGNNLASAWQSAGAGPTSAMTISNSCQKPQLTNKLVAATNYKDSGGTRGMKFDTSATVSAGWNFYYQQADLNGTLNTLPSVSEGAWMYIHIPTNDTGHYSMFGVQNLGGDFASTMISNGQIYIESFTNPNGVPDVGSAFNYTADTWYYISIQFVGYVDATTKHTLKIYDATGNLLSTQQKFASALHTGGADHFGIGRGGDDGTPAGSYVCYDGISFQWIGAPVFPITP